MSRVSSGAGLRAVTESIAGLQRLRREMARSSARQETYESQRRALEATIKELRKFLGRVKT